MSTVICSKHGEIGSARICIHIREAVLTRQFVQRYDLLLKQEDAQPKFNSMRYTVCAACATSLASRIPEDSDLDFSIMRIVEQAVALTDVCFICLRDVLGSKLFVAWRGRK